MGGMRNAYNIFVGKPEGKRPLGGHRHRWEDNFRMDLREIGWKDIDWMHLTQCRDRWRTGCCERCNEPFGLQKKNLGYISYY
jgi:hypothetical protein